MLGLLALFLTLFMIYTLVKNALFGTQLSSSDKFTGSVEVIIPMTERSQFYLEPWLSNLSSLHSGQVKVHVLIDGHHKEINAWQELHSRLPFVEVQSFLTRPLGRESIPWMIEQVAGRISADVVIIADPELVPTQFAFFSIGKLISEKQKPYFILPQTNRASALGEAIATLNPTLALASVFGFRKFRRNISHPLVSIAQGWMGMPLSVFRGFDWHKVNIPSWKEALAKAWDFENKSYILAFGEKHLLRYYPENLQDHIQEIKSLWIELWSKGERSGVWLYLAVLFIWSFPVFCMFTHPFWSLGSLCLLILYRFFTKIVFQESITAIALHPFGCVVWAGTLVWWGTELIRAKYFARKN